MICQSSQFVTSLLGNARPGNALPMLFDIATLVFASLCQCFSYIALPDFALLCQYLFFILPRLTLPRFAWLRSARCPAALCNALLFQNSTTLPVLRSLLTIFKIPNSRLTPWTKSVMLSF